MIVYLWGGSTGPTEGSHSRCYFPMPSWTVEEEEEEVAPRMPRSFDLGDHSGDGVHKEGAGTLEPFDAVSILGIIGQ